MIQRYFYDKRRFLVRSGWYYVIFITASDIRCDARVGLAFSRADHEKTAWWMTAREK